MLWTQVQVPEASEKLMATIVEDADQMLELEKSTKTSLFLGRNMRHMPVVHLMHRIIQTGRIGDFKAVRARHFAG